MRRNAPSTGLEASRSTRTARTRRSASGAIASVTVTVSPSASLRWTVCTFGPSSGP
ncbi:MAG: hypothetical protein M5U28_42680 [Sandaracinaceae bacterium]|nr:hypothetical protein [Sandaracinaceae bacterium]